MNGETSQPGLSFPPLQRRPRRAWLHLVLLVVTLFTTTIAGALQNGVDPLTDPWRVTSGLPFSLTLMTILLVHEMGHYLMSRYHGVKATLPYFIPAPPPLFIIGTFGAFIKMESRPADRRSLFDVGVAGPVAGLVLAIPAVIIGLQLSTITTIERAGETLALGSSLLLNFLSQVTLGLLPDEANIIMHPVGFAGWIGLFVTAMNLLPIGQLDGGHAVYALFGRRHIWVSRLALVVILALGFMRWWDGWLIWGILLLFMGVHHPPPLDPYTPLDLKRKFVGWLMLFILVVTFIPVPFSIQGPKVHQERPTPQSTTSPLEAISYPEPSFNFGGPL